MLAAIRDTLVAELGIHPWIPSTNSVNASIGSGPFARLGGDGEIRRYSSGRSPGTVSDADWPRATAIVAEVAGQYGGALLFGTAANTTLSLTTGCHLTREAFLRGPSRAKPRPKPVAPQPAARLAPPEPPQAVAPKQPDPPKRRRRRTDAVEEDFDMLQF